MPDLASVNGVITPSREAKISAWDRGFIFGDGVYDVIHIYNGKAYRLKAHIERLYRSAEAIELDKIMPPEEKIEKDCVDLINKSGLFQAQLYIQVTRGVAPRDPAFPKNTPPTVFIAVEEFIPMPAEKREKGVKVIAVPDYRWRRNDIKSLNLIPKVLNHELAVREGAYEGIYVSEGGYVTEATGCNVFIVEKGEICTVPLSGNILTGVTRGDIIELADELGIKVNECEITLERLISADEVFLSGTLTEILGVVKVDENVIADGRVGNVTNRLYKAYHRLIERETGG
ncbi:MAG: D-amino acid aminotransferase [Myxococcota bacterium]